MKRYVPPTNLTTLTLHERALLDCAEFYHSIDFHPCNQRRSCQSPDCPLASLALGLEHTRQMQRPSLGCLPRTCWFGCPTKITDRGSLYRTTTVQYNCPRVFVTDENFAAVQHFGLRRAAWRRVQRGLRRSREVPDPQRALPLHELFRASPIII